MHSAHLLLLAALAASGDEISVQPSKADRALTTFAQNIISLDGPSQRTEEILRRYDLSARYAKDPGGAIAVLERFARQGPSPELVYALAELSWIEGKRAERKRWFGRRGDAPLERYLDTVGYAYDFLFDPELADGRAPADPRFRLACELYNAGLDRLIRAAKTKDRLQPGDTIRLKIQGDEHVLKLVLGEHSPWPADSVDELMLASDFEVTGLDSRSRQYGLGVPLFGIRRSKTPAREEDRFFAPETAFPLTAILRPNRKLREATDTESARECTLELVDPVLYRTVGDGPGAIAVEADVTTPLAYMWSRTDLSRYRWTGLLRPGGEAAERAGLMLLRPYDPDKIPIVMVHGLASSPLAWIPMLNELLRDSRIRQRCQFLLYVYPTGTAVPIAASGLRDALLDAKRSFDVRGATPEREFEQMVLLGHSMGGLLSELMAVDSGDALWQLSTDRPFQEIIGPPDTLAELQHYSFFKPLPFVRRVVFLATPHRGSDLSRRIVGRVSSSLISEGDHYTKLLNQLIRDNPDAFDRRKFRHLPTSIETLAPDSDVLAALARMKPGQGVVFHSIIGNLKPGSVQHASDGVVSYKSAHFEGAVSERVVRSDHGVQKDPEAILEVRRILFEHLGGAAVRQAAADVAEPSVN